MKTKLPILAILMACTAFTAVAQAPVLGTVRDFALFSSNGAVSNTGNSLLTGNVGTNNGSSTNFGNVDGVMHDGDGATAIAAADLTIAYNQLFAAIPDFFPAPLLGNGQTLYAGTYDIGESASLNNTLTLDAEGDANAVFIFKVQGAFSSAANSQVLLVNGAVACNVFWKIEGLVDLAANTSIKGTIVANNAAIILNTGVTLEGRALSTTGAVTVSGVEVTTPLGCGTPVLTGPVAPVLNTVACFTVFSGNGEVTNTGVTFITGDVGTNVGLVTGFQTDNVDGTIHPNPDTVTAQCAADLSGAYTYLQTLPTDIELLYPAAFGSDLVLTPHTYAMEGATVLTNDVYLNAQGNPDAVFVIKISGALSTSTYANVMLINGAQAKNVFWKVDGATSLNDYTNFTGTLIGNNGAMIINTGVHIDGRALSTSGGVSCFGISAVSTGGCTFLDIPEQAMDNTVALYPNPSKGSFSVQFGATQPQGSTLTLYNVTGSVVGTRTLETQTTKVDVNLAAGMYFYTISGQDGMTKSGKLIVE
jgi:ice-binding like protein/type IX secretion system substrate protein